MAPDNTVAPSPDESSASEIDDKTSEPDSASDEPTEDQTPVSDAYTVQRGDTLSVIADKYNTTVAKLAAYNGIADPNSIYAGQIIKIPPPDWEIPVADSTPSEQADTDQPSEPTPSEPEPSVTEPPEANPSTESATEPPAPAEQSDP